MNKAGIKGKVHFGILTSANSAQCKKYGKMLLLYNLPDKHNSATS